MGPHYANFRAITEDLLVHQALRIAGKATSPQPLSACCAIRPKPLHGSRAKQVFSSQAGATGRCMDALTELLSAHDKTE